MGACDWSEKRKSAVWNIVFEHVSRVGILGHSLTVNLFKNNMIRFDIGSEQSVWY